MLNARLYSIAKATAEENRALRTNNMFIYNNDESIWTSFISNVRIVQIQYNTTVNYRF